MNDFIEKHLIECEEYEGQDCICESLKEEKYWNTLDSQINDLMMEAI